MANYLENPAYAQLIQSQCKPAASTSRSTRSATTRSTPAATHHTVAERADGHRRVGQPAYTGRLRSGHAPPDQRLELVALEQPRLRQGLQPVRVDHRRGDRSTLASSCPRSSRSRRRSWWPSTSRSCARKGRTSTASRVPARSTSTAARPTSPSDGDRPQENDVGDRDGTLHRAPAAAHSADVVLVSILVFALSEVLPGDMGRVILGPYAHQSRSPARPQAWASTSPCTCATSSGPATSSPAIGALRTVQLSVLRSCGPSSATRAARRLRPRDHRPDVDRGRGVAGLRRDSVADRAITVSSLSLTVVPEFVSGVMLTVVFAVFLMVFHFPADAARRRRPLHRPLLLPAAAGHPAHVRRARLHRAHGARRHVEVLEHALHPYRHAQGPAARRVVFGHALRNAMAPTVAVIGSQVGWLSAASSIDREPVRLPGHRQLIVNRRSTDLPMLEASVLVVARDLHALQPDRRHRGRPLLNPLR